MMNFEKIVKKSESDIEQYGWSFMFVDADKVSGMESFSYTIGFEKTYAHPEIIIFGLPAEISHKILSAIAAAIKENETMPLHEPVENIIGNDLKVIFKPLDHDLYADYLSIAIEAYGTYDFRTQIMLWPDKEGKYPFESGYDTKAQRSAKKAISASDNFDVPALGLVKKLH
jgi:hypothetical protein